MIAYVALLVALLALVSIVSKETSPTKEIIVRETVVQSSGSLNREPTAAVTVHIDKNAGSVPETYAQVGYLSGPRSELVPLYGKRSEARRGRWFYYAIVKDTKVPVFVEGRDCMREVACDEIYDGSSVIVPDIDPGVSWKVKIYGNERRI